MSGVGKRLTLNFGRSRQKKAKSPEPRDELDYEFSGYRKGNALGMSSTLGIPTVKGTKSGSLGSLTIDSLDPALSKDDIMSLTHDVGTFSKALGKLKCVFVEAANNKSDYDVGVAAHDKLGEVLCILKNVLQKYPALHTTDVLTAAAVLITKIKSSQYEDSGGATGDLHSSIDQLALAFSSSVSEYLMGDIDNIPSIGKTKSYDNLASADQDPDESIERDTVTLGPGELVKLDQGIDIALQRAKIFSKYTKDIIYYMEKRAALECEYAKNLAKLASSVRHTITEESFLPFQSTYCTACDQDMEYIATCQSKSSLLHSEKFIEPLNAMRIEYDRLRKHFKDEWTRELRKMHDSDSNVRKAKSMYMTRQQEFEKAKEMYQKAEAETGSQNTGGKAKKKKVPTATLR